MLMEKIDDPWKRVSSALSDLTYLIRQIAGEEGQFQGANAFQLRKDIGTKRGADDIPPAVANVQRKLSFAKLYLTVRRERCSLHPKLFGDPAWDILIDLFVSKAEGRQVTISSACIASCSPPTTALRYLGQLEAIGLICSNADRHDKRLRVVCLSTSGEAMVGDFLERMTYGML